MNRAAAGEGAGPGQLASRRSGLRICLAASGGGHLRQLLDIESVWSHYDHFFVTEGSALGQSIAAEHRTHFVTHAALGQARLGKPWLLVTSALRNMKESWRAIRAERPDVVISTGAGAVFFAVVCAKLVGAHIIIIESFARFHRPSVFMRCAASFADAKIVQSPALARWWKDAEVFDPLVKLDAPRPEKEELLFVTVGATLPFDRMIAAVAQLKREGHISQRVIAQVGRGGIKPEGVESVETLSFAEIQSILERADTVVCHGGTGSLITALKERCRTVAMPRSYALGESYDHHQEEITDVFARRGLIRRAANVDELRSVLAAVASIEPQGATTNPQALIGWLKGRLGALEQQNAARRSVAPRA